MILFLCLFVWLSNSVDASNKACNVFGDPNVITFDGFNYKFGGKCTYVLAMDCVDMSWIVYGEFTDCGTGTCLENISLFHTNNGARDAVYIGRGWVINHLGQKLAYKQNEAFQIANLDMFFDGLYLTISIQGEGVTLVYDGALGLIVSIDDLYVAEGETCGLCGNNDNLSNNEYIQLRDIGNDVKKVGLSGIESLVFQWKVDRGNYCPHPINVKHPAPRRLPCGNDFRKNEAAREACQELVDNQELFKCHETLNINTFYEACLVDYCYIEVLAEGYPVACSTGSAYAKHCKIMGVPVRETVWRSEMSCPEPAETQRAIIEIGVEQPDNGPFANA